MNFAGLNPFEEKRKVKIFGERNSATTYLEWLLLENLKIRLADYYMLGWRHRLAPGPAEITEEIRRETLFLCLFKNPYSWLLSMHRRPYKQEELKKLRFSEFLRFPYGDYADPITLWNKKNASYLAMADYTEQFAPVIYEDLLADPELVLSELSERFQIGKAFFWFKDNHKYVENDKQDSKKRFHRSYYLNEKWKRELKPDDLAYINDRLDADLMKKLDYEFFTGA